MATLTAIITLAKTAGTQYRIAGVLLHNNAIPQGVAKPSAETTFVNRVKNTCVLKIVRAIAETADAIKTKKRADLAHKIVACAKKQAKKKNLLKMLQQNKDAKHKQKKLIKNGLRKSKEP